MKKKNYSKEQVIKAIDGSNGVVEYVAARLGCQWNTARKYIDMWEETRVAFDLTEINLHSVAYQSFHKAVANGERWALERILETSARRNGHGIVQHQQLDHTSSDGTMSPTEDAKKKALAEIEKEFG